MIVSEARREANRRNSARSTGPRTERGKARVRANAIKHGMTAETVIDDESAFKARAAQWHATLKPTNDAQRWFADEIARITLKLDPTTKVEQALRDNAAARAETCWDLDRRLDVEALARKLPDRPSEVVAALERSVQGCDFLIDRWLMLAHVGDRDRRWNADHVRLAYDLLGTPVEVRGDDPCLRLDESGRLIHEFGNGATFARAEAARLRILRDELIDLDELDRSMTAAGLSDASTLDLRRFRRYETSLHNRLKWCFKQFDLAKSENPAQAPPTPVPSRIEEKPEVPAPPVEAKAPEKEPKHATPEAPMVLPTRLDRKLDRAASRREAKERKLERRRA